MKKIFIGFLVVIFISSLIIFAIRDRLSVKMILSNFEKQTGLEIKLQDENTWIFYPSITYSNPNVEIANKENSLLIKNANFIFNKSYWPTSPIHINLTSPILIYEGMEVRNLEVNAKYINNIINIKKLSGKIIEGNLKLKGQFDLDDNQPFNIQGEFNNISLNTLLKQSKVATWERVNIKLSSNNFILSGEGGGNELLSASLTGTVPITGSFYLTSSEEERFGAALLSLLVEKIPNLSSISKSVNFLLSKYANIPSSLQGSLTIDNGFIYSEEIIITNKEAKSIVKGSYNLLNDTIDGTIYFIDQGKIFLEASLKGQIENPQILVGGKIFTDNDGQPLQDIKQILDEGINSLLDKILQTNE